jgi:hypothetical protein
MHCATAHASLGNAQPVVRLRRHHIRDGGVTSLVPLPALRELSPDHPSS